MSLELKKQRYLALAHAMQSGVRYMIDNNVSDAHTPKHLRTGINAAMSDQGGLVALLIKKELFTEDEYMDSLIEFMEREVKNYEYNATIHAGVTISFL